MTKSFNNLNKDHEFIFIPCEELRPYENNYWSFYECTLCKITVVMPSDFLIAEDIGFNSNETYFFGFERKRSKYNKDIFNLSCKELVIKKIIE